QFAIRRGAIMAAPDKFTVTVRGRGGHAAQPHRTIDPILISTQIISNLQAIAARNADPLASVVVSVTRFEAGTTHNIIPDHAVFGGTVRSLDEEVRQLAEARIRQIVGGIVLAHGPTAEIDYQQHCPATVNHDRETQHAIDAALYVGGATNLDSHIAPAMAGEDFAYMLK